MRNNFTKLFLLVLVLAIPMDAFCQRGSVRSGQSSGPTGGESGGGGDPRAAELVHNLHYFCRWVEAQAEYRDYYPKCIEEQKDLADSLQVPGRKPRVFSAPDKEVVDEFGNPKDAYTQTDRRIKIAYRRWSCNSAENKLRTSAIEMAILLGMIGRRYDIGGIFAESEIFRDAEKKFRSEIACTVPTTPVAAAAPAKPPAPKDTGKYYVCGTFCGPTDGRFELPGGYRYEYRSAGRTKELALLAAKSWCSYISDNCGGNYANYVTVRQGRVEMLISSDCFEMEPNENISTMDVVVNANRINLNTQLRNTPCR